MRKRLDLQTRRRATGVPASLTVMMLSGGCSRAPSFNILGSFFPSWLLCGLIGILLTVGARVLLVRLRLEQDVAPLIVVYPCLTAFFTFTLWLLLFS